ncbi:MAG: sensor histidine kinase [Brevundimonas aurantiaca]|uniref:sensor histidine kinase n=1 Tax=Brevundimonas aurantiaca TaxID=74316 RepID=UPI004034818A
MTTPLLNLDLERRPVAGGLILTVIIQALFWAFVFAANRPALPPAQLAALQISKAYVVPVPGLEPEPIERSGRTLKRLPFNTRENDASPCVRGARFSAYQLSADVSLADPDVVYGVHVSGIRDNYAVWLNGRMVATPRGRFSSQPTREGNEPLTLGLTPELIQPGKNRLDIVAVANGCHPNFGRIYVGPENVLRRLQQQERLTKTVLPFITVIASSTLALTAVFLLPLSGYSGVFFSLAAFMISLAVRGWTFIWYDADIDRALRDVAAYSISATAMANAAFFLNRWTQAPARHLVFIYGWCLACIIGLWCGWAAKVVWVPQITETGGILLCGLYFIWRMTCLAKARPAVAARTFAFLSVALTATIHDLIIALFGLPRWTMAGLYFPFVLIGAIAWEIIIRGIDLYRGAAMARDSLAEQVQLKEAEIRSTYLRLREQERMIAINEERQRLVRDMHDGVGGHLVSLLAQLRGGAPDVETLREGVRIAIDDLRLIIDSMDGVDDSLEVAIAIFHERMAPRLRLAGIELTWSAEPGAPVEGFGPEARINIYRILQEAITNAVKHAKASRVDIRLKMERDAVVISVSDNGIGLPQSLREGGKGLPNMNRRADRIGGTLDLVPLNPGLSVRLQAPLPSAPEPGR